MVFHDEFGKQKSQDFQKTVDFGIQEGLSAKGLPLPLPLPFTIYFYHYLNGKPAKSSTSSPETTQR